MLAAAGYRCRPVQRSAYAELPPLTLDSDSAALRVQCRAPVAAALRAPQPGGGQDHDEAEGDGEGEAQPRRSVSREREKGSWGWEGTARRWPSLIIQTAQQQIRALDRMVQLVTTVHVRKAGAISLRHW